MKGFQEHGHSKEVGMRRFKNAALFSWSGLRAAYKHEPAFRYEAWLAVIMLPLALWLARTPLQFTLLVGSVLLVLTIELVNSAIEAIVDRVGLETNELSGRAKDMGSAAVFLSLTCCALTWASIAFDNWWS